MMLSVPGPEKGRQILGRAAQGVYRGLVTVPGSGKGRQVPCRVVQGVYSTSSDIGITLPDHLQTLFLRQSEEVIVGVPHLLVHFSPHYSAHQVVS